MSLQSPEVEEITENGMLNIEEAARYLGRSTQTLYNWICTRRGPRRLKRLGRWYFRRVDLDSFIKHNTETFEAFR